MLDISFKQKNRYQLKNFFPSPRNMGTPKFKLYPVSYPYPVLIRGVLAGKSRICAKKNIETYDA